MNRFEKAMLVLFIMNMVFYTTTEWPAKMFPLIIASLSSILFILGDKAK